MTPFNRSHEFLLSCIADLKAAHEGNVMLKYADDTFITRSSAVAERPRDASSLEHFGVTRDHSRSFEMTLLSMVCVSR